MQTTNTKSGFLSDVWDIAKEVYTALFGESVTVSNQTPIVRPEAASKVVDLTLDDNSKTLPFVDISADDTPEEMALAEAGKAKNIALTFKYLRRLDVNTLEEGTAELVKTKSQMLPYQVKTSAYEKYHHASKKNSLEQVLTLMQGIGNVTAKRLLNSDWLGAGEIDYYFGLLQKKHADVVTIESDRFLNEKTIAKLLETLKNSSSIEVKALRNAKQIIWPACKDKHWFLNVMIKNSDGRYDVYSLDTLGYNYSVMIDYSKQILQALYPDIKINKLLKSAQHINVPRQHNLVDCGASVCFWAKEIVTKNALPKEQTGKCDYSQFRFTIAEALAKACAKQLKQPIVIEADEQQSGKSEKIVDQFKKPRL